MKISVVHLHVSILSWLRLREWKQTHKQLVELAEGLKLSFNDKPASYENLHRALLTGLLSFIANKTDEKMSIWRCASKRHEFFLLLFYIRRVHLG